MQKVLYISLSFVDVRETTSLYSDLIQEFITNGHDVLVLAPHFYDGQKSELVVEGGIKILRVPVSGLFSNNKYIKGLSNVLLPFLYKRALKKLKISLDFDLVMMPTPPITLLNLALWVKKKSKAKVYLILRDIFPQNAIDLKIMKPNSFIHNYFRKKEIALYELADKIGCMSPANIAYIERHNPKVDKTKLHLLPNWENSPQWDENLDENEFRAKYGLNDKIVAIYGGNIGLPQRMENIIELAQHCSELEDLVFFLVGFGTEHEKIAALIKSLNLKNVILIESVPKPEYVKFIQISDIGLISLNQDFTIPNFPSKANSYYGYKKPILASVDVNTDFGIILEEIGAGFWSEAGDVASLKNNLLKLYKDPELRKKMGENGYQYMKNNLLTEHAYRTILNEIN